MWGARLLGGCSGANYQCVDEEVADEDATRVSQSMNLFIADYYELTNPSGIVDPIISVTVYARAKREHTQGQLRLLVRPGLFPYYGSTTDLTSSWANYSYTWTTNPATGSAWGWSDINSLEAGIQLKGQGSHSSYCTQLWVVVEY